MSGSVYFCPWVTPLCGVFNIRMQVFGQRFYVCVSLLSALKIISTFLVMMISFALCLDRRLFGQGTKMCTECAVINCLVMTFTPRCVGWVCVLAVGKEIGTVCSVLSLDAD